MNAYRIDVAQQRAEHLIRGVLLHTGDESLYELTEERSTVIRRLCALQNLKKKKRKKSGDEILNKKLQF
jgi:hypothetical protein